jgi:hypothetical protein
MNLKRNLGTAKKVRRKLHVIRASSNRGRRATFKKEIARLLAGRPILISSPLGPIVKPQGREQIRVHYDMLAANEYCKRQGKALKELTPDEMQQFQVEVKVLKPTHRF